MFLKRIEMQGFKSFADKTVIAFDDPITAVVGPNGCGKSNISDAVRWVLGEQSARSLRGEKMNDVIFAGSADRRKVNMAEVTLVFDNSSHILNDPLSPFSPPDLDGRVDSPALSGRGSRPSGRTSG